MNFRVALHLHDEVESAAVLREPRGVVQPERAIARRTAEPGKIIMTVPDRLERNLIIEKALPDRARFFPLFEDRNIRARKASFVDE